MQAAEQARGWCLKNRPDEPSALVAVAVLEATILQARASAATAIASQPDASLAEHAWFRSSDCLAALQRAADQSAAHRDLLYRVLAPTVASVAPVGPLAPFALQLLLGAAVAEPDPARLDELIATARKSSAQDSAQTPAIAGEIRYLLGSALAERQARPEAVQVWTDLAEQAPKHDRAVSAIHQAVALAADDLRRTGPSGTAATRAAFVRAVRVLRQQNPNDANLPELSYASAAALETDAKFEEAVEAYMAVPVGHTRARDADMGRLRCWRQTLDEAVARRQDPASVAVLADKARAAVRSVRQRAATRPAHPAADCRDATLDVAVAELLNHQFIGGAAEASQALAEFETLYPACQNLLGPVLRQRILALRQLKQLGDARGMVDRYLAADPENAGSVMAGLLQAMHEEMLAALDRADESAASRVADEAAQLSRALLEWSTARPGRMSPSHLVVLHLWYAAALVQADRPVEAVAVLDQVPPAARASLPADSATLIDLRLTRADALLANQQADQAAAIYGDVWQHSVEQSAPWWHAFIGSLRCHARLPGDTHQVLQSIRQQRYLAPDLGGGRWRHQIEQLESAISAAATQPAQQPASQPDADRPR